MKTGWAASAMSGWLLAWKMLTGELLDWHHPYQLWLVNLRWWVVCSNTALTCSEKDSRISCKRSALKSTVVVVGGSFKLTGDAGRRHEPMEQCHNLVSLPRPRQSLLVVFIMKVFQNTHDKFYLAKMFRKHT